MARVYGRTTDILTGLKTWVVVKTDDQGFNDAVMVTALAQCLKLNLGESPFYANWGIPGVQSVVSQVAPDYYVALMQQRFAGSFASLIITRQQTHLVDRDSRPTPVYNVKILTHRGARIETDIAI